MIEVDWNGERAAIGAGIYAPDFPGAMRAGRGLRGGSAGQFRRPETARIRELRGADGRKLGVFRRSGTIEAIPAGSKARSIVFGINAETGTISFSGSESSFASSGRIPQLLFDGRDAVEAVSIFGEGFWYYNFHNPATQQMEPKVAFVKLVRAEGVPLLVGSGHRPVLRQYRPEPTGN